MPDKQQKIIKIVVAVIAALIIFRAGELVGYYKASFSHQLGDRYSRIFTDHDDQRLPSFAMMDRGFASSHGAVGTVVQITTATTSTNAGSIVIAEANNIEKVLTIDERTIIRRFREAISLADLKPGDRLITTGEPNSTGEVVARFIRVLPTILDAEVASTTNPQ